jgi:hypothetical protein
VRGKGRPPRFGERRSECNRVGHWRFGRPHGPGLFGDVVGKCAHHTEHSWTASGPAMRCVTGGRTCISADYKGASDDDDNSRRATRRAPAISGQHSDPCTPRFDIQDALPTCFVTGAGISGRKGSQIRLGVDHSGGSTVVVRAPPDAVAEEKSFCVHKPRQGADNSVDSQSFPDRSGP